MADQIRTAAIAKARMDLAEKLHKQITELLMGQDELAVMTALIGTTAHILRHITKGNLALRLSLLDGLTAQIRNIIAEEDLLEAKAAGGVQ